MIITASKRWSRSVVLNQWAETPWGGGVVCQLSCLPGIYNFYQ